ncbi:MAG: hypothetical protein HYT08_04690 [Candidatus Levybacteria bacterium]|nr:hypothetical protein [Candidatus Levybacteria bacterium]
MKSISISSTNISIQSIGRINAALLLTGVKMFEVKVKNYLSGVLKRTFIYSFWDVLTAPVK